MNITATKIAPAAATPIPTYIHASFVMPRNVFRIVLRRNPLKGTMHALATVIAVGLLTSCATAHRAGDVAKPAIIDCAKQSASGVAALLAAFGVRSAIAGKLDVEALETTAKGAALGVATCAVASFLREYKRLAKEQVAARGGDDDPVVELQAMLERVSGGAKVVLADGTAM